MHRVRRSGFGGLGTRASGLGDVKLGFRGSGGWLGFVGLGFKGLGFRGCVVRV